MADFIEHDLDTPTEADLDSAYGTKFLSAADVGDRKIRTKVLKVRKEDLRGKDDRSKKRFVLHLEGLDKPMVLNETNKTTLVGALGKVPANWIGASIGVYVDPNVMYGGVRTGGLRLKVLGPTVAAATRKEPEPSPPKPLKEDLNDDIPW
jgi:hypothetical protein